MPGKESLPVCVLVSAGHAESRAALLGEGSLLPDAVLARTMGVPYVTRYCLFDLDGTLTDPEPGIVASLRHGMSAVGLPEADHGLLRAMIGPPLQDGFLRLGVPPERLGDAVRAYRERYTGGGMYDNEVIAGIPAVLEALVAGGRTLAVATSKPAVYAEKILAHFGLDGFFAYVAGATLDGSRRHKADVIRHALDVLGAPPEETVMIGDRGEDVAGAAACGVRSIAVTWGFGEASEFTGPGVVAVVDTPGRLLDVLSQTAAAALDARDAAACRSFVTPAPVRKRSR